MKTKQNDIEALHRKTKGMAFHCSIISNNQYCTYNEKERKRSVTGQNQDKNSVYVKTKK